MTSLPYRVLLVIHFHLISISGFIKNMVIMWLQFLSKISKGGSKGFLVDNRLLSYVTFYMKKDLQYFCPLLGFVLLKRLKGSLSFLSIR